MVKHNNIIPNVHLRKHWSRQKNHTHHDQPAAKLRRYRRRQDKAAKLFPRPLQKLRPVVASQTRRYAGKVRYGRGFTLLELKTAKITAAFARTVGISVDHRRTNTSAGQLQRNVDRLNMYREKLILFPRREGKPKKGCINDSPNVAAADACIWSSGNAAIVPVADGEAFGKITAEDKAAKTFFTLRKARTDCRYNGRRIKKVADAEAAKK